MIFVSYKSNTANLVRLITEALMMNDVDVWFAEYQVLIKNYPNFQEAIDQGIKNAESAIFFTNEQWNNSKHCQYEFGKLFNKLGPRKIVEVRLIPSERGVSKRYLDGHTDNYIELYCNVLQPQIDILKSFLLELAEKLGITLKDLPEVFKLDNPDLLPNLGVSISTGLLKASLTANRPRGQDFMRPMVIYKSIYKNKEIGLMLSLMPFESVLSEISQNPNDVYDDHTLYQAFMDYAKEWEKEAYTDNSQYSQWKMKTEGLHLLFSKYHSHFGLTYTTHYSESNDEVMWERRYLMLTEESNHKGKGEASLVFFVKLAGDKSKQIKEFCKFSCVFDKIARTFKYSTPKGKYRIINNFAPISVKVLYTLSFLILIYTTVNNKNIWLINGTFFFFGIFVTDLIMFCNSLTYQRITWLMQPVRESISSTIYEQVSGSIFNMLFIEFFKTLFGFVVSLKELFKKPFKHTPVFLFVLSVIGQDMIFKLPEDVIRVLRYTISFWAGINFGHSIVTNMLDRLTNPIKYYKKKK